MQVVFTMKSIPPEWFDIISSRPFFTWDEIEDEDLPIPNEFVRVGAFYKFVERGRVHGCDVDDWLDSERELKSLFRAYVASLKEQIWASPAGGSNNDDEAIERQPIETVCLTADQSLNQENRSVLKNTKGFGCTESNGLRKMGNMRNKRRISSLSPDDPRAREIAQELSGYTDAVGQMTSSDRRRYRDKVLAVLVETGEIIADADTAEELQHAVRESTFRGRDWRLVDGPTSDKPLTVEELKSTIDK